jgi:tetratricopeptide (TPR) repeat protein
VPDMSDSLEALLAQASQARREHRFADAKSDLLKALEICRSSANNIDLARTLKALGQIERDMDHAEAALSLYQEAAAIYRAQGDELGLAHTVRHVADIQQELGRTDLAEPLYREALAIYRAHPEARGLDLANAIRGLAILTFDGGNDNESKTLWQEARELYASASVQAGVTESSRRLALLAAR